MRTTFITVLSKAVGAMLRTGNADRSFGHVRRILVVKTCCLGDVLLTTPLLHALRQGFPQAHITYAVGVWSRPMVASSHDIDAVLTIPDRWTPGSLLAVARTLREREFDAVFVPERTPMLGLLTLLARIPLRVGLDSLGRGFAYTHPVAVPDVLIHEAALYSSLAEAAELPSPEHRLRFYPTTGDRDEARRIVDDPHDLRPIIVIHPGGGSNPGMTLTSKRWLPERWAAVADDLQRRHHARIILVGSADEQPIADAVTTAMETSATVLAHRWSWGVLAALIERADLFLGHDTGMMHLAQAVGTPVVAVFGPSDPQVYGPYNNDSVFVWRPTVESPCFHIGSAPTACPCAGRCMRNITADAVIAAAEHVLGNATAVDPVRS